MSKVLVLREIINGLREEAKPLRKLVRDEDSDCIQRALRAERLRTLEYVISYLETAEDWDWTGLLE